MNASSWFIATGIASLAGGMGPAAAEPAGIKIDDLKVVSGVPPDPALEVTCGPSAERGATWTPSAAKSGRFIIAKSGSISIDEKAPADTIQFTGTEAAIAVLDGPGSGAANKHVACGRIGDGVYELPDGTEPKEVLLLRVFDTIDAKAHSELVTYRRDKLATLQKRERQATYTAPVLHTFVVAARTGLLSRTDASIDQVEANYKTLQRRLADVRDTFGCDLDEPVGLLSPAVCDETFTIAQVAEAITLAFEDTRGKPPDVRARELRAAKIADAITALKAEEPPVVLDEAAQCEAIEELRWLYTEDMPRLVNRSQIPNVDVVYGGRYGLKRRPVTDVVPGDNSFALVVANVPVRTKTAFREREGKRTTLDGNTLLSAFIGLGLKTSFPPFSLGVGAVRLQRAELAAKQRVADLESQITIEREALETLGTDIDPLTPKDKKLGELLAKKRDRVEAKLDELRGERDLRNKNLVAIRNKLKKLQPRLQELAVSMRVATPSLICRNAMAPKPKLGFIVDEELPPADGIENLAHVFESVEKNHEVSMVLCSGECSAAADEKTDKASLSLTPSTRFTFTLLAELGAGVAFNGGAFEGLSPPEFVPVLGNEGPDQVFELARTADPRNVISTSLLVAYRLPWRFAVGLGPTLLVGTSGAVFQQWNLRAGVKIANGTYLTTGPSVRAMQIPNDYAIGDRISVMRPASGNATAPTFAKHYEAVWEWQFGLSFDLAGVGGLTSDIYKALGGK